MARVVRAIPRGRVLSYSRVAVLAGLPGRARLMGKVMGRIGARVPWWRVLRADRTLAEEVRVEQARRLRAEGIRVADSGRVPRSAFLPIGDEALHRRIRRGSSARAHPLERGRGAPLRRAVKDDGRRAPR